MKRMLIGLVVAVTLLTGCDLIPSPATPLPDTSPAPNETQDVPVDMGDPDGVARAFLSAWEMGDYAGMYSLLSPTSQAEYSLEEFREIYTSNASTMTLIRVDVTENSLSQNDTTARMSYDVEYTTRILSTFEKDNLEMFLTFNQDTGLWSVVWAHNMILPELSRNNTLELTVETPSRANIYDRNGQALVTANAGAVQINVTPGQIGDSWEDQLVFLLSEVLRISPNEVRQNYVGLPADWSVAIGDVDAEVFQ
ncbi:MAG: hypothetical protein GYB68_15960, partial [Chloroflexi bacterium]|nr:hypothetical protein [Chloroflexota bacterium]